MIVYNSRLAKHFLQGKGKKCFITLLGVTYTTESGYIPMDVSLEMKIHRQQYAECFWSSFIPVAILCTILTLVFEAYLSWILVILPFLTYHILYWIEYKAKGHSAFDYEAVLNHDDAAYPVMRRSFAWKKWYWKDHLRSIN